MPAKWQQWMPFRIDAFKASPAVQAMHPTARIGYLYLLAYAWQTEDCTVPNDALELAEQSGLGDELWAVYGPRILRKFDPVNSNGRLRNQVCFEEWERTRAAYQNRAKAADRTNTVRSPYRSPSENATVTVEKQDGNRAVTVYDCVYVPVDVSIPVSNEKEEGDIEGRRTERPSNGANGEFMAAGYILEELNVVGRDRLVTVAAESIQGLVAEGGTVQTATEYILGAGRLAVAAGEVINRFWFTDQKYRPVQPMKTRRQREKDARREEFMKRTESNDAE